MPFHNHEVYSVIAA